ncbi:GNAT family N-acetyltransferase [Qipengyuania qiaonensis]|uniref:N-acetyltransferase n=1 Tax=Qipengyuania qiaonensis TaxID=2867240 RepID=A0ABS7J8Y8_9SPHN|nr:GNAT family N-acetyltransferase [Qipengyuania qiaonensis]MBX7482339.1 N-acetyltransferase [Qipengyuania qiaonensis]
METAEIAIRSEDRGTKGEYIATDGTGAYAGKLTWTVRGEARDAEHTVVPPDMRGRGIAAKLVEAIVNDARSEGFRIVPSCSYVAAQFDRHPEWANLRA